jgi:hypothetical protein
MDEGDGSHIFHVSNHNRVSTKDVIHVNSENYNALQVNMQRTSTLVHARQVTPSGIERDESRVATMLAEITKTYAQRENITIAPLFKNDPPIVAP